MFATMCNTMRGSMRYLPRSLLEKRQALLFRSFCFANEEAKQKCANVKNVVEALAIDPYQNKRVGVKGWVQRVAEHKNTCFIRIGDGLSSDHLQVVLSNEMINKANLNIEFGMSVYCEGVIEESRGKEQRVELVCDRIDIIGESKDLLKKFKSSNWGIIRQYPHLRMRLPKYASLMRIRSALIQFTHKIMNDESYVHITTPIITSSDCEGAGKVFTLKSHLCNEKESYFGNDAHLTVSGQMHLEAALGGFSKVYTLSPAFRAENSQTLRHVSEFTMLEVEEAFVDSVHELMDKVESLCKALATHVFEQYNKELTAVMESDHMNILNKIIKMKFIRLTYDEAIGIINESQKVNEIKYGEDIGSYHEKVLLNYFESIPVFISEYPFHLKPFYMKRNGNKALCFDLICENGGEVCGGSVREDNFVLLKERTDAMSNPEAFNWYLDLRKYGSVAHGGFGIGFDRYLQAITGIRNIKDAIPFPRWPHHCAL